MNEGSVQVSEMNWNGRAVMTAGGRRRLAAAACGSGGGAGERGSVQVLDMNWDGLVCTMYLMMGGQCR